MSAVALINGGGLGCVKIVKELERFIRSSIIGFTYAFSRS